MKRNQVAKTATAQVEAKLKVKKVSKADISYSNFVKEQASFAIYFYISLHRAFQAIAHKVLTT